MKDLFKHSISETVYLAFCLLWGKIFINHNVRLVRLPIFIRGKRMIEFGKRLTTGRNCRFDILPNLNPDSVKLKIGDDVQLNDNVHICAMSNVTIGNQVLMASNVYVSDNSHGSYKGDDHDSDPSMAPIQRNYRIDPVKIGDRVWIGEGVMILPGVSVGNGAVIGAHAVVNTDIPENCIAVGAPAKIIKKYNPISKRWEKI